MRRAMMGVLKKLTLITLKPASSNHWYSTKNKISKTIIVVGLYILILYKSAEHNNIFHEA